MSSTKTPNSSSTCFPAFRRSRECRVQEKTNPYTGVERGAGGSSTTPTGHAFQAKRFNRRAHCAICTDRIWGLGRQGYKCINCKLLVHKKCHKLVTVECGRQMIQEPMPGRGDHVPHPSDHTEIVHKNSSESINHEGEEHEAGGSRDPGKAPSSLGLADFDLLRVIGRGSYAKVLLVRLKKTERIYAMKVVKKELVNDDE
ncbi:hypothetical protein SRHO_G00016030, partial [Serrasalmus rhombeus]